MNLKGILGKKNFGGQATPGFSQRVIRAKDSKRGGAGRGGLMRTAFRRTHACCHSAPYKLACIGVVPPHRSRSYIPCCRYTLAAACYSDGLAVILVSPAESFSTGLLTPSCLFIGPVSTLGIVGSACKKVELSTLCTQYKRNVEISRQEKIQ